MCVCVCVCAHAMPVILQNNIHVAVSHCILYIHMNTHCTECTLTIGQHTNKVLIILHGNGLQSMWSFVYVIDTLYFSNVGSFCCMNTET